MTISCNTDNCSTRSLTRRSAIVLLIFVAAMLPQLYKLSLPPNELVPGFLPDDAFYYYKTALNIRSGFGSTFDGENMTNGFHPLWMGLCVLLGFLTVEANPYFYLVLAVNLLLVLFMSVQAFRMFEKDLGLLFGAVLVCLMNWNYISGKTYFSGLETPLYLLLVLTTVQFMTRVQYHDKKNVTILGILFGLTFLARTEFILFLPISAGYFLYRTRDEKRQVVVLSALILVATFSSVAAPFLAWNYSLTGHFEQVSGLVKKLWPREGVDTLGGWLENLFNYFWVIRAAVHDPPTRLGTLALAVLLGTTIFSSRFRRTLMFLKDPRIVLLCCFSAVVTGYYFLVVTNNYQLWYFAVPFLTVQIVFVQFLRSLYCFLPGDKRIRGAFIVFIVLLGASYLAYVPYYTHKYWMETYRVTRPDHCCQHEIADWIKRNLPRNARIGMWNAGYVGYFSGRTVVNLDGLINGKEFYDYMADGKNVWQYVVDKRLDYLSEGYCDTPAPLTSTIASLLEPIHRLDNCSSPRHRAPSKWDWYVWRVDHSRATVQNNERFSP